MQLGFDLIFFDIELAWLGLDPVAPGKIFQSHEHADGIVDPFNLRPGADFVDVWLEIGHDEKC